MDFKLSDEQRDFVSAIRDFCERECGTQEKREQLTEHHSIQHNAELYRKIAELGWLGVTIPEEYGGSGGTMLDACLFMEETSRGLAPIGGYATTLIVAGATKRFGGEDQKQRILGGISKGSVEAIAMTEPESGSDVGSLSTEAVRSNGGFVINGQKVFISNAHISDHVLVVCRTTKGANKHEGLSMIFVPAGTPGGDEAHREALVLVGALGGATDDQHVVGDVGVRDEDLLPVDHEAAVERTASVEREPTSEPDSGCVMATASRTLEIPPRILCFWSSPPKRLVAPATIRVVP